MHDAENAVNTAGIAIETADQAKSTVDITASLAVDLDADLTGFKSDTAAALKTKVDKIMGKGLSTEDYTTAEKTKLADIAAGAEVNVQSDWNESNAGSDAFIKNKPASLPASGGDADTTDGKHASDFATGEQGQKAETALTLAQSIKDELDRSIKILGLHINEVGDLIMTYSGVLNVESES